MACEHKYFDYLPSMGRALGDSIGRQDLVHRISLMRRNGSEDPDSVVVGCRTIVENMVDSALKAAGLYIENATLSEKIVEAYESDLVSKTQYYKLNEIRVKGNQGAHNSVSVKVVDARAALELLDDVLRMRASELAEPGEVDSEVRVEGDSIFVVRTEEDLSKLERDTRLAAAVSGDGSIETEVKRAVSQAAKSCEERDERLDEIADIIARINNLGDAVEQQQKRLFDLLDEKYASIRSKEARAEEALAGAERRVREILDEHDYIRLLLQGKGSATDKQFEVMAFPRGSKASTRILQITGGAGTGKTLCLVAKLIDDIKGSGQGSLFSERPKRGLFVCYNKALAAHVERLLDDMPEVAGGIEVVSFDRFVNQLAHVCSTKDYRRYNEFAQSVRFPSGWEIAYLKEEDVSEAMRKVALRHPEERGKYYFNVSSPVDVSWVLGEIEWLDSRYDGPRDAAPSYQEQMTTRVGRGNQRLPRKGDRKIILEIWDECQKALDVGKRYTLAQAVRRLLSATDLPVYDSIAVDEIQDLSINSLRLLLKMRADERSRVYLSGDENQKIFQRDFTWKELDAGTRGHAISLSENKRNSLSIENFANRLLGRKCSFEDACEGVHILPYWSENYSSEAYSFEKCMALVQHARTEFPQESVAIIGNREFWDEKARGARLAVLKPDQAGSSRSGIYVLGERKGKGLEFDTVIFDCAALGRDDEEEEKRLLYVNCTRARKRLYLCYEGEVPAIIRKYYPDFLDE